MQRISSYDYTKEDIIRSLKQVGVTKGDNIFIHSNIGFFGNLKGANNSNDYYLIFKEAIFSIIGVEGTLVVPTFTYSYCWGKEFNIDETPGVCGFLSEMVRKDPDAIRSEDANFSVAAIGKNAEYFTENAPAHSFGKNSFWERFLNTNGKFCNFNFDSGSTFLHFVEKCLQVNYRYDKKFHGRTIKKGQIKEGYFYHFVCDLNKPEDLPNFEKFDHIAKNQSISRISNLGRGQIVLISARDTYNLVQDNLIKEPRFLLER